MTNEDLRNKFLQFLIKLHSSRDLNLLSQDDSFKELISKFRNDFESLQKVIDHPLWYSVYNPKILEAILNNGVDIQSNPGKLDLISGRYSWHGQFFGYNAIFRGENVGYNIAQTLTVSIARIMLQNPNLLEKQVYGSDKENLLHSLVNTIFDKLNPGGSRFRHTERENCKKHLSLLFTLMVFINPKSLEQKCSDLKRDEETPMELFSHHLLSCKRTYQYVPGIYNDLFNLEELYNNFERIIELSKDNSNILSQKVKELINYINSIQPSSQIDSSKLNSIISEIKDQIKTQGDSPAEKCIVDVGNLLIEKLPAILLDRYISNLRSSDYQTGNVSEEMNEKLSFILEKEVFKTIELLNKKSTLNDVINHIEDPSVQRLIEKHEEDFLKFQEFKKFLNDSPAPHEPISQERLHRKAQGKALMDIGAFFERHEEEYLSKLKSEKAQEKALPCVNTSLKGGKKAPLKENNQNTSFKITKKHVIISGIFLASAITGIYFESFIAAAAVAAILTIAACCIERCCNSQVDQQLTSSQIKGDVSKFAAQHSR